MSDRFEKVGFRGEQVAWAYQALGTYTLGSAAMHGERTVLDRAIRQPVSDLADFAPASLGAGAAGDDDVAYRAVRGVKRHPLDIVVGTKGRFDERSARPTVEREVAQRGLLLYG